LPLIDAPPVSYDPPHPCNLADRDNCPDVPYTDVQPIVVDPPHPCAVTGQYDNCPDVPRTDPSPVTVDVPDACAPAGPSSTLDPCTVPYVSPTPVIYNPPDPCAPTGGGFFPCKVEPVDPPQAVVDVPDACNQTNGADPCFVPLVTVPPTTVDVPGVCTIDDSLAVQVCQTINPDPVVVNEPSPAPTATIPPPPCLTCLPVVEAATTRLTPPGQILVLNANVEQAFEVNAGQKGADNFGTRLALLSKKIIDDGMGYVPDVLLLQEVYLGPTLDQLQERIEAHTGYRFKVAKAFADVDLIGSAPREDGDSAILYNSQTMEELADGHLDNSLTNADLCTDTPEFVDVDLDGIDDCAVPKIKRTASALLQETDPIGSESVEGSTIAVASVHLLPGDRFKNQDVEESKKDEWSRNTALHLRSQYGDADSFGIGGDFNRQRCEAPLQPLAQLNPGGTDYQETSICQERPFWRSLQALGFRDTIYAAHGYSDPTLKAQYRYGNQEAQKRIDYLFTSGKTLYGSASHDLSCGGTGSSCRDKNHPDRYSDHRLNWAFVGLIPRSPALPATSATE
jgi:hypothetical protein